MLMIQAVDKCQQKSHHLCKWHHQQWQHALCDLVTGLGASIGPGPASPILRATRYSVRNLGQEKGIHNILQVIVI